MKPLLIELFCGLGAVSKVFEEEGWRCIGFDIERHVYGPERYPCQLVLQDCLTLLGRQFREADFIWASPPCQEYSYMAMPWSRAKKKAELIRQSEDEQKRLTALFDACFRIQREACIAAGRHIPMVVENVKGAQPWVGRAKANFGSFYLWGDVETVNGNIVAGGMKFGEGILRAPGRVPLKSIGPQNRNGELYSQGINKMRESQKVPGFNFHQFEQTGQPGGSFQSAAVNGVKVSGMNWSDRSRPAQGFNMEAIKRLNEGTKTIGHVNKRDGHAHTRCLTNQRESDGVKQHLSGPAWFDEGAAKFSSASSSRKAASAMIAKIPEPLARHFARVFKPAARREAIA